ncbi:MAG TPA: HEAT repeat domain-containing protein [Gemmatimonadaceae bacterium]|nr:HEAT repeat domain-containing protein [Gemmatimonadaceae bacterium]
MNIKSLAVDASAIIVMSLITQAAEAQSIASRVAAAPDGKVRITFPAKPEICGYNNSISRGGNNRMNWSSNESADVEYDNECSTGPVRMVLWVDNGLVTKLRTHVGGNWRTASGVTDLGAVSAKDATDYLLALASTDRGSAGRDAILPMTLADGVVIWPGLVQLVRNDDRPLSTRKQAMFWLGAAAGDRLVGPRAHFAKEDDVTDVKKSAVFALSQRRNGEAVPALIEVARNNRDPEVRKSALFWLGQTMDSRAITLFEEILRK